MLTWLVLAADASVPGFWSGRPLACINLAQAHLPPEPEICQRIILDLALLALLAR